MELERFIKLSNKYGLHARASMQLAQLAEGFESEVLIAIEGSGEVVDVKSILSLLTLGAEKGQAMHLSVRGNDAEAAMSAIVDLFERKFDEE